MRVVGVNSKMQRWTAEDYQRVKLVGDYETPDEFFLARSAMEPVQRQLAQQLHRQEVEFKIAKYMEADGFEGARRTAIEMGAKVRRAVGDEKLASKIESCFDSGRIDIYEKGKTWVPYDSCGQRKLCPFHARGETKRRLRRYLDVIQESAKEHRLQFVTLTVPNIEVGQLQDGVKQIWDAWAKLRKLHAWHAVQAAMVNLETTYSTEAAPFHVHLHVLVAVSRYQDFSWAQVQQEWYRLTQGSQVDFEKIAAADEDALYRTVKELVKYPSKFNDGGEKGVHQGGGLLDMPDELFSEWLCAFRGARTMRTYGEWYRVEQLPDEQPDLGELVVSAVWRWDAAINSFNVFLIQEHNSTFPLEKILALEDFYIPPLPA
jgi:hypothetical protein